ncbi:MAG: DUF4445 domain-containing protein, partial [Proteobacteria bacterium]|nr:DUF4445 domain-containing protein [Pseudomonadota bacterium]
MKNDLTAVHRLNARVGGESLLSLLIRNRLSPASDCNGLGLCGKCKVQIVQGTASPLCSEETEHLRKKELDAGFRLACLCRVEGEVMITSSEPEISMQIQEQGFTACTFPLNPVIKKQLIVLEPQTHESRYQCLVSKTGVPIENTLAIAGALADSPSMLTAVKFQNRLIGIETADTRSTGFGIAVDIGTTTLVAALIDFNTGKTLATASAINPQFQLGSDVLSRIHFAQQSPSHLDMLSSLLRNEINRLAADLLETAGADPTQCYLISVAGNTVMLHLLLGIDPRPLGRHPYQPVFLETLEVKASDLDIALSPFAVLQCLPGLSAFIGADIQAGLLALNLTKNTDNTLFIDMGTNGEIVLCFNGKMIATSTAAGPALEGMNISCGMKACNGAIDHVMLSGNKLDWTTIGDASPKGLCGSGLLDLVAALLKTGIIQKSGRIVPPETAALNGVEQIENSRCFRLVQPGAEN